ncbi:MAG: Cj0069 family protein, partial [Alphaproteobacteria bacterium]
MRYRTAILFPAPADPGQSAKIEETRLAAVATALREAGIEAEAAPYTDERVDDVRAQLFRADGVLVWVNPIERGRDRTVLDAMLEDVARKGVFVSAHPDTIRKMGTKEVLYRTRSMSWGCDTRLYPTLAALHEGLPRSLAAGTPRVLKQIRGNGGDGVWKVECATPARDADVRIRHAKRGSVEETISLGELLQRFEPYYAAGGQLIDQAYQPRLTDGMVRCYLVGGR